MVKNQESLYVLSVENAEDGRFRNCFMSGQAYLDKLSVLRSVVVDKLDILCSQFTPQQYGQTAEYIGMLDGVMYKVEIMHGDFPNFDCAEQHAVSVDTLVAKEDFLSPIVQAKMEDILVELNDRVKS